MNFRVWVLGGGRETLLLFSEAFRYLVGIRGTIPRGIP
jgi:hypothetical protein